MFKEHSAHVHTGTSFFISFLFFSLFFSLLFITLPTFTLSLTLSLTLIHNNNCFCFFPSPVPRLPADITIIIPFPNGWHGLKKICFVDHFDTVTNRFGTCDETTDETGTVSARSDKMVNLAKRLVPIATFFPIE